MVILSSSAWFDMHMFTVINFVKLLGNSPQIWILFDYNNVTVIAGRYRLFSKFVEPEHVHD